MVDINVNKNQGLISAIKAKLNAENIDTSNCNASVWSQILEQVTIENEQNKKDGKQLIYHKGNNMSGDWKSNFVVFQGVINFSQKLWNNICKIVKGEAVNENSANEQSVQQSRSNTFASGIDKIKENNFIDELNQVQQVEPPQELKENIEKAQKILIEQLANFTDRDLQTLGITSQKRDRLIKYLENVIYDGTHNTMQGKGIWIVVSERCQGHEDLANMITMLMHEANHCDENFLSKYPEYADDTTVRYVEGRESNPDIMLVNTKAEERACETLGLLTSAILYKKGVIKKDYERYGTPVSQYIDSNGQPTQSLRNDVENWVAGYTNYPEDMRGNISAEHMHEGMILNLLREYYSPSASPEVKQLFVKYKDSEQIQNLLKKYNSLEAVNEAYMALQEGSATVFENNKKFEIQEGDVLVVNDDGKSKQVTLGKNGVVFSPVDSAPIFQLVNAEFGGRIILNNVQPTDIEYLTLEYLSGESQVPDFNNYQNVSIIRNGKIIYEGKLYNTH